MIVASDQMQSFKLLFGFRSNVYISQIKFDMSCLSNDPWVMYRCHYYFLYTPSHHHLEMSFILWYSMNQPKYTIKTIQAYSESPINSPLAQQEQSTQNMSLGQFLKAHFLEMSCLVIFFLNRLWKIRDETWETGGGLCS